MAVHPALSLLVCNLGEFDRVPDRDFLEDCKTASELCVLSNGTTEEIVSIYPHISIRSCPVVVNTMHAAVEAVLSGSTTSSLRRCHVAFNFLRIGQHATAIAEHRSVDHIEDQIHEQFRQQCIQTWTSSPSSWTELGLV